MITLKLFVNYMWRTVLRRVTGVQPMLSVMTSSQWWCADRWQPLKESILGAVEMAQQLSALVLLQRTRVWFQILTWWLTATCTFNSWALNAFCCSQQALFTIVTIHTCRYIYTHKIMSKSKCLYFGLSFWRFQTIMIIPITYELWQGKHITVEDGLRVKGFLYKQKDLSSDPQHSVKIWVCSTYHDSLSRRPGAYGDQWSPGSVRESVSKTRWKAIDEDPWQPSISLTSQVHT